MASKDQDWSGFEEVQPAAKANDWSGFEEVKPAAAAAPAEKGIVDRGLDTLRTLAGNMAEPFKADPSVMAGYQAAPAAPGAPVRPDVREQASRQFEAATPAQRAAQTARPDWRGDVARDTAQAYQQQDALARGDLPTAPSFDELTSGAPVPAAQPGKTVAAVDQRREQRIRREVAAGATPETAANIVDTNASAGSVRPIAGTEGLTEAPKEGEADYGEVLTAGGKRAYAGLGKGYMGLAKWAGDVLGLDEVSQFAGEAAQRYQGDWDRAGADLLGRIPEGSFKQLVSDTAPSALQQMPGIAATGLVLALTKNPAAVEGLLSAAVLTPMGAQTFGTSYLDGEKAGLSKIQNTAYSLGKAAAEVLPERISLRALFNLLGGTKNSVSQWVGAALAQQGTEHTTEQITTISQFVLDKLATQPDLTLADLQHQMVETFKATALQAPVLALTGVAGKAAGEGVKRVGQDVAQARDLTAGLQINPEATDAAARAALDPANAQLMEVSRNVATPTLDAGSGQAQRPDAGGGAGLVPDGAGITPGADAAAGASAPGGGTSMAVGAAQSEPDAALTMGDPLQDELLSLERAAFEEPVAAAPTNAVGAPLPIERTPQEVAELEEARHTVAIANEETDPNAVQIYDARSLPDTAPSTQRGAPVSRATATLVERMGEVVGRRVFFYDGPNAERFGDGFVWAQPGDGVGNRIFVRARVGDASPERVFGHEVQHGLSEGEKASLWAAFTAVGPDGQANVDTSDAALLKFFHYYTGDRFKADEDSLRARGFGDAQVLGGVLQRKRLTRAALLDEFASDIFGNRVAEPETWRAAFAELKRTDVGALRKIANTLRQLVRHLRKTATGLSFETDRFINNLDAVRQAAAQVLASQASTQTAKRENLSQNAAGAVRSESRVGPYASERSAQATADYFRARGTPKTVVTGEDGQFYLEAAANGETEQRTERVAERPGSDQSGGEGRVREDAGANRRESAQAVGVRPGYGEAREHSVRVVGTHYSKAGRTHLSGAFYRTGAKGAELARLERGADPELWHRVYFYVDLGNGVTPEEGVGNVAHEVELANIYDAAGDPLDLKAADLNAFELAVVRAGFDGYLDRGFMPGQGAVVLLGKKHSAVPVARVGEGKQAANGQTLEAPKKSRTGEYVARLNGMKGLPGGEVAPARWASMILGLDPELHAELERAGVFEGAEPVYRSELAGRYRQAAKRQAQRSAPRTQERENQMSITVGGKPGEFGWSPAARMAAALESPDTKAEELTGAEVPPFVGPTQERPNLAAIGESVRKVLAAKAARDVIRDITGAEVTSVTQIHGSWEGKAEPSFVLAGTMSFEQANEASKLLGWAFAQDATVAQQPWFEEADDQIDAVLISQNKVMTAEQIERLSAAAREAGLDYSTTVDGRGAKFLHFGDARGLVELTAKAKSIAAAAGLTQVGRYFVRSNLNEAETYLAGRVGQDLRGGGDRDAGAGPSDLFRRAVDHLLVPYAKAVGAEGYRFSPERFGERFGLTDAEVEYITAALRPKSGKALSVVPIVTGAEKIDPPRNNTRTKDRGVTKNDLLWALQNRAATVGFIQPGDYSDAAKKTISEAIADEVIYSLGTEAGKSAVGWYDAALHRAKQQYERVFPELRNDADREMLFDAILGIASQGNDVHSNAVFAGRMYFLITHRGMSLGEATKILSGTFGKQTVAIENNYAKLEHLLDTNGYAKAREFFNTRATVSELNAVLRKTPELFGPDGAPLKIQGAKDQVTTGWSVFGPKIGSFINNLHGDYSTLTADLWFSRTWNRYLGFVFGYSPTLESAQYVKLYRAMLEEARTGEGRDVVGKTPAEIEAIAADPEALLTFAREVHDKREREYPDLRNEAVTPLRQAAKNLIENRADAQEAPRTDRERGFQQATVEAAQRTIRRKTGVNITVADIQAVLWYFEKNLFSSFGVGDSKAKAADYADAAERFVDRFNSGDLFYVEKPTPRYVVGEKGDYLGEVKRSAARTMRAATDTAPFANLTWRAETEDMLSADLGGGWTATIYHGNDSAELQIFTPEGQEFGDAVEYASLQVARDAAPAVIARRTSAEGVQPGPATRSTTRAQRDNLARAFLSVSQMEDVFQVPRSEAKDLETIVAEVMPEASMREVTKMYSVPKGRRMWRISRGGSDAFVTLHEGLGDVWVNVAGQGIGKRGSQIYAIVGNWAANNGYAFVGDPDGLSETGKRRRLENAISLKLKYPRLDVRLDPSQLAWLAETHGVTLQMREQDSLHNLAEMLRASYEVNRRLHPELEHVEFSADGRFIDRRTNREFDFEGLASGARGSLAAGSAAGVGAPGVATLRRAALAKSVVESTTAEGDSPVLEALYALRDQSAPAPGVSSEGGTPAGLRGILYSARRSPLGFYSQLSRAVESVPARLASQPGTQWKLWLASNAGKLGVKADEIQWSGINEWLDLQGSRKVAKDEIGAYLAQGGVQIQEVAKGGPGSMRVVPEDGGFALYDDAEFVEWYETREQAEGNVEAYRQVGGAPEGPRFPQYTLPGGENYRELLLTLPAVRDPGYEALRDEFIAIQTRGFTEQRDLTAAETTRMNEIRDRMQVMQPMRQGDQNFRSSHWDEPNILAHIRLNDRTDAEGKRVLFVEEIQSDWGQEGKKKGFGSLTAGEQEEMDHLNRISAYTPGGRPRTQAENARLDELLAKIGAVPAAPFVTDTKAWVGLALKRVITMAVQEGYDRVAFVNGQQSADRYDLSKQVDSVIVGKESDGSYSLVASRDGREVVKRDNVPERDLDGLVGKEMAAKIVRGEGRDIGMGEREFTGLALKVGGEGMKAFYDRIVPQVANDVLKKLGGGKVRPVAMLGAHRVLQRGNEYQVWTESPAKLVAHGPSEQAALDRALANQIGFDITPAMREKVKTEGLPLFSTPRSQPPAPTWAAPDTNKWDTFVYRVQDRFVDMKRVREAIAANGRAIDERFDGYLSEELYHGKAAHRTQVFLETEVEPLMKKLKAYGIAIDEFEEYLHARHAPERNARMMEANPNQAELDQLILDAEQDVVNLQNQLAGVISGSTFVLEAQLKGAISRAAALRNTKPYRGTEAERAMLSGMSDAEAAAILARVHGGPKAAVFKLLGRAIDAIAEKTRAELVTYGLEPQSMIDDMEHAYKHYVPLRREMDESDLLGDQAMGTGTGFSVRGSKIQRATGSLRPVEHILANLIAQREQTIVRGEKNRVVMSLYGMALQHPNPEFWTVIKPGDSKKGIKAELQGLGLDPAVIDNMERAPTEPRINPRTGLVEHRVNPLLAREPTVIALRVAGQDRLLVLSRQHDRAVRLATALKNADTQIAGNTPLAALLQVVGKATRYISAVNTQYNPVFGLKNFIRDVQGAALNLSTTPLKGKELKILGDTVKAMRGIWLSERHGRANGWATLFAEFQAEGAQTGYRDMFGGMDDRARALERMVRPAWWQRAKPLNWTLDLLSDYNNAIENAVRLATYKAAKDTGLSKAQAASLAKNITVNFNRKGQIGREASAMYAFFNASVQGTGRIWETLKGPRGKKIMAGGVGLGVLQVLIGAAMMGDDWDEIPEFVRSRNFIIPLGGDAGGADTGGRKGAKYLTIPMPLGFNALVNVGRIATEIAVFRNRVGERMAEMALSVLDATNPLGSGDPLDMVLPSVLDPFFQLGRNEDSFGRPIAREDLNSLDPTPGEARGTRNASTVGKLVAKGINRVTGGDAYVPGMLSPTPDQVDFIFGQITGGVGRESLKTYQALEGLVTGDRVSANRIPVAGMFYGKTNSEVGIRARYYETVQSINTAENGFLGRAKDDANPDAWLTKHPEATLGKAARKIGSQISELNKYRNTLGVDAEGRAEKKRVAEEILALQVLLIELAEQQRAEAK